MQTLPAIVSGDGREIGPHHLERWGGVAEDFFDSPFARDAAKAFVKAHGAPVLLEHPQSGRRMAASDEPFGGGNHQPLAHAFRSHVRQYVKIVDERVRAAPDGEEADYVRPFGDQYHIFGLDPRPRPVTGEIVIHAVPQIVVG